MFRKHSILLISATFIFSSCALFRKTETSNFTPHTEQDPSNNRSTEEQLSGAPKQLELSDGQTGLAPVPEAPVKLERPQITFGETESANVRIPLHLNNPFPESGELALCPQSMEPEFCYPYKGKVISPYGRRGRSFHSGIDIKAVPNDTIRAAMPGVVRMAKPYSGYGNIIVVRHYNGIETVYAHQSKNLVSVNDIVEAGTPIGLAGRTGRATTEHLHFEVRVASQAIDPRMLVDADAHCLRSDSLYLYNRDGKILAYNHPRNSFREEKTETAPVKPTLVTSNTAPVSSDKVYYTVKQGDTLSRIARNYSTSVAKICELNGISSKKVLQIKERLRVK